MAIHFGCQGLSLRTTLLHCKDYIVAVAKIYGLKNIGNFVLHYFYQLGLV